MEKKKTEKLNNEEISRSDFLKIAGMAGLGLAGLGAFVSQTVSADEGKKGKYIIVITSGGNNPNRAIWPFLRADVILKKGLEAFTY